MQERFPPPDYGIEELSAERPWHNDFLRSVRAPDRLQLELSLSLTEYEPPQDEESYYKELEAP